MSPSTLALSQRILARLMPPAQAEALLGDLLEERRLRLQAGSHVSVAGWCWRQLASSVPVLLWASMRRGAWLVTVVTAVASFIAALGIQLVLQSALSPMTTSKSMRAVIMLLSFAAALAPCGYVAASIRLGAARLLAFLVFAATLRDAGEQRARPALVRWVASRPRSGSHNRRRGSVRAATSCPPLAGLLRRPLYARARTPRDPDRRRRPSRSIPVQYCSRTPRNTGHQQVAKPLTSQQDTEPTLTC